jgi:hypothetical protein
MNLPFRLETDLETRICTNPQWQEGAAWGNPRPGHPEGRVAQHIAEVLASVERNASTPDERRDLRLIALLHDTFKYRVDRSKPRIGDNHHAMIARHFAEHYIDDPALLDVIELHDTAYNCWRSAKNSGDWARAEQVAGNVLSRLGAALPLYVRFYRCDNATGDKDSAPLAWFEDYLQKRGVSVPSGAI